LRELEGSGVSAADIKENGRLLEDADALKR
jgi:hypothetical protein